MSKHSNPWQWVAARSGDSVPVGAVHAGITKTDGDVYVARIGQIPGKVNIDNSRFNNFWVQAIGCRSSGEILVTEESVKWVKIKQGDLLPKNVVLSGRDQVGDRVWVGRTMNQEPGKIICRVNEDDKAYMWLIWSHHEGKGDEGYILTISK